MRSKTAWMTALSPLRSGLIVIPRTTSLCMHPWWRWAMARRLGATGHLAGMARAGQYVLLHMSQDIRFLEVDGRELAYSVLGEGPPLVVGPRWVSHLEEEWDDPEQRSFYGELAKTHTVVRFDRIGCGLSSR